MYVDTIENIFVYFYKIYEIVLFILYIKLPEASMIFFKPSVSLLYS